MSSTQTQPQTAKIRPLSPSNMAQALRAEAATNPVFKDICTLFATRERARAQVTMAALRTTLAREGFNLTRDKLEAVLKFLESIGIGKVEYFPNNTMKGLYGIKFALQSIGKAALSADEKLQNFTVANTYKDLYTKSDKKEEVDTPMDKATTPVSPAKAPVKEPTPPPSINKDMPFPMHSGGPIVAEKAYAAELNVNFNGEWVKFSMPHGLTIHDIESLLAGFYNPARRSV